VKVPTIKLLLFSLFASFLSLGAQTVPMQAPGKPSGTQSAELNSLVASLRGVHEPVLQTRQERYTLHPGDTMEIDFPFVPAFNQVSIVQPDGYIALHNLGEVRVQGKTVPETIEAIKAAYSKILENPVISIDLKDFERPYFIASGEVSHPGKYELRGATSVAEAVAIAGGTSDVGKRSQVLVFHRLSDSSVQVKQVNLKRLLDGKNLREDVYLQPGDLLFVPKSLTAMAIKALMPHTTTGLYVPLH